MGIILKFSSIQAIQQDKVDSYRDAVRNFNILFALVDLLSMISYFLLRNNFLVEAEQISCQVYGLKFDRSGIVPCWVF